MPATAARRNLRAARRRSAKTARDRMQANAAALSTPAIPMATEPAFQFKA